MLRDEKSAESNIDVDLRKVNDFIKHEPNEHETIADTRIDEFKALILYFENKLKADRNPFHLGVTHFCLAKLYQSCIFTCLQAYANEPSKRLQQLLVHSIDAIEEMQKCENLNDRDLGYQLSITMTCGAKLRAIVKALALENVLPLSEEYKKKLLRILDAMKPPGEFKRQIVSSPVANQSNRFFKPLVYLGLAAGAAGFIYSRVCQP